MSFLLRNKELRKPLILLASSEVSEGMVHYYQHMRSIIKDSDFENRMGIAIHPKDL